MRYFLVIWIVFCVAALSAQTPLQIYKPGYYQKLPDIDRTLNWYGLIDLYGDAVLQKVQVKLVAVGHPRQYLLSTQKRQQILVLIGTRQELAVGDVPGTLFRGLTLVPNCQVTLPMSGEDYLLEVKGNLIWQGSDMEAEYNHVEVSLQGRGQRQVLITEAYSYGTEPLLLWYGDIDADGCPDLLIDNVCTDSHTFMVLALSGAAGNDQLNKVLKVAVD